MGKSVNRVFLLGNIGKDPEIKSTGGGTMVANFSLATSDRQKDSQGNWQDRTEWHSLIAFGKTAEIIRGYVKKGSKILIEGKIQTRSWDDKKSGEKKYRTEIIVNELTLLSGSDGSRDRSSGSSAHETTSSASGSFDSSGITDDDIPF